jgi:chaperonin GroES
MGEGQDAASIGLCPATAPRAGGSVRGDTMAREKETNKESTKFERIEPVGKRVVIRKDEDKKRTKGGIQLPDNLEIPTITGRIVAISAEVDKDENLPLRQYDKILFNPKHAIPVELEPGNQLFVVPVEDVVAVFRRD